MTRHAASITSATLLVLALLWASTAGAFLGSNQNQDLLPPDEAFPITAHLLDDNRLLVEIEALPGYYLYRDKIRIESVTPGLALGEARIPHGEITHDEFFGEIEILRGPVAIEVPYEAPADALEIVIRIHSQGCADIGICYPPQTRNLGIDLETGAASVQETRGADPERTAGRIAPGGQDEFARTLATGSMLLTVVAFFGFGLLLALTPCVFPMVPILSGLIVGQGRKLSTGRAFALSLSYVLAMAVTYTVAGVIVGLSGSNVQMFLQQPWVIGSFAGLFVVLALSMFGLYEIRVPSSVQTRLSALGRTSSGQGTLAGAALMGLLSALIVSPCVTAPLVGALIYIAHTGDAWLGGVALFALSLGMGAPLIAFGVSAGKLLPKVGPWMETVKAASGFVMLGVAVWMLERVLSPTATLALWGLLLLFAGIWFGALDSLGADASSGHRLRKGIAIVMALWGGLSLAGVAGGGGDLFQPLRGIAITDAGRQETATLSFRPVKGLSGLETALAGLGGRPAMLDIYADWCVSCKELEAYTFTDPDVRAALSEVVLLKADVTAHDATDRELLARLGLFGPPAILFYTPDGKELEGFRLYGFVSATPFAAHVRAATAGG